MDEPAPVTLRCKTCGEPCIRSVFPPYPWTHVDDWVPLGDLQGSAYDHPAAPDYLDV